MSETFQNQVPPQNIEAEQAVLGAIFLQPSSLIVASEIIIPEDFYKVAHQKIYQVMLLKKYLIVFTLDVFLYIMEQMILQILYRKNVL